MHTATFWGNAASVIKISCGFVAYAGYVYLREFTELHTTYSFATFERKPTAQNFFGTTNVRFVFAL